MAKKLKNKIIKIGDQFRTGTIAMQTRGEGDDEKQVFEISISSETPVARYFGEEILDHARESVDLDWLSSGNAPLLLDHDRTQQIGVVENVRLADGRLVGDIRFSNAANAQEINQDVVDGIRSNISVGYRVERMKLEEEKEDGDVYRVTRWQPFEVSLVSIPADQTVGVGRADSDVTRDIEIENLKQIERKVKMTPEEIKAAQEAAVRAAEDKAKVEIEAVRAEVIKDKDGEIEAERSRVSTIVKMARAHGDTAVAASAEFIQDHKRSVADFADKLAEMSSNGDNNIHKRVGEIGMSNDDVARFSFCNVLRALESGDWDKEATLEREACEAAQKEYGRSSSNGIIMPKDVLVRAISKANTGANLIATETRPNSFIELLRNKMLIHKLGAIIMPGLVGDVEIPRLATGTTASMIGDGDDAPESNLTIGNLPLSPKTIAVFVAITRKMLLQSSPSIEMLAMNDIATAIALGTDFQSFYGDGIGNNPEGIKNTTGVGSVTFVAAVPTYGELVDMETSISSANADVDNMHYVCNANLRGSLKQKPVEAGHTAKVWENNQLNGYGAHATNQAANGDVFHGDFSQILLAEWGALELEKSKEAKFLSGGMLVRALQDIDIGIRQPSAFCVGSN